MKVILIVLGVHLLGLNNGIVITTPTSTDVLLQNVNNSVVENKSKVGSTSLLLDTMTTTTTSSNSSSNSHSTINDNHHLTFLETTEQQSLRIQQENEKKQHHNQHNTTTDNNTTTTTTTDNNNNNNNNTNTDNNSNNDNNLEEKLKIPLPILLLAALFALYMIRKRFMEHSTFSSSTYEYHGITRGLVTNSFYRDDTNGNIDFDDDDDDDYDDEENGFLKNGGANKNSNRSSFKKQEMVPLSTTNDEDEWGWKDTHANRDVESALGSGGDNEKHNSNHHHQQEQQQEQQQQNKVLLNSNDNDNSIKMLETITQRKDSWDEESADWEEHEPIVQSTKTTTTTTTTRIPADITPPTVDTIEDILRNNFAGSTITSFSKPSSLTQQPIGVVTNKKKKVVKEEEDIFASMGLSSIPSSKPKSSSTAIVRPKPTVTRMTPINPVIQQPTQEVASSSLSATYLTIDDDEPIDGGEKWGDDSDLDDLLED